MALLASCWNAEMRSAGAWPALVIEIDSATLRLIRFAVTALDNLPDFGTAASWTGSGRLILLEVWRNSEGNGGIRFVLGPGAPEIRQRYYDALTGTGNSLTARKEITSRFTRLASQSLALEIDELADGPNQVEMVIERIIGTIMAYGAERIPVLDHALARPR
jgi:hypothetical protein